MPACQTDLCGALSLLLHATTEPTLKASACRWPPDRVRDPPVTWRVAGPSEPRSSETVVCSHLEVEPLGSKHGGQLTVSVHAAPTPHHVAGPRPCTVAVGGAARCCHMVLDVTPVSRKVNSWLELGRKMPKTLLKYPVFGQLCLRFSFSFFLEFQFYLHRGSWNPLNSANFSRLQLFLTTVCEMMARHERVLR